jgi:hypothetical protein
VLVSAIRGGNLTGVVTLNVELAAKRTRPRYIGYGTGADKSLSSTATVLEELCL